jgi:hypothetical protein
VCVLIRGAYPNCRLFGVFCEGVVVDGMVVVVVVFRIARAMKLNPSITWSEAEAAALTRAVGASGWARRPIEDSRVRCK